MGWEKVSPGRPIPGTGQNIAVGASSTQNSTAFGNDTQILRLSTTGSCHVEIGPNPTATSSSMLLKSSDYPILIRIARGEKVAVIQDGASTGNCNVVEYTF